MIRNVYISVLWTLCMMGAPYHAWADKNVSEEQVMYSKSMDKRIATKRDPWSFSISSATEINKSVILSLGYRVKKDIIARVEHDISGHYQSIDIHYAPEGAIHMLKIYPYITLGLSRAKMATLNPSNYKYEDKIFEGLSAAMGMHVPLSNDIWLNAEYQRIGLGKNVYTNVNKLGLSFHPVGWFHK